MKRLVLLGVLLVCAPLWAGMNLPEPQGYVTDTIGLLKPETIQQVNQICEEYDSVAQMVVCIVDSTKPYTIEEWGIKLAEKWKPGYKGLDNGVILILAKSDRKIRIEVGRGLEDKITDARAGRIISDTIAPLFKAGKWDEGIIAGIGSLKATIAGEPLAEADSKDISTPVMVIFLIIVGIFVLALLISWTDSGGFGSGEGGSNTDGWYGGGGSRSGGSGWTWGGGGSSNGGSSGGGGFSGGGGSFSGGGASGGF